jgi:hypothetical protein
MINFVGGGKMGDFIQTLYAVKNICEQKSDKANLYIGHGGDVWRFSLERTYDELRGLIEAQHYINKFGIFPSGFNEAYIDLNYWRTTVKAINPKYGSYDTCWSEVIAKAYDFFIPKDSKWISVNNCNEYTKNKVLIHRSKHRHNSVFPWEKLLNSIKDEILFVTTDQHEWHIFPFKNNVKLYLLSDITEMAVAINSCKTFIGNQSAIFSLACSLDVPRLVELEYDPAGFYMDEIRYSDNISWFLNDSAKYFSKNFIVRNM